MVMFFLKLNPPPSKRQEALELLHYQQGPTLVTPGCLDCSTYERTADEAVLYFEQWQSREQMYDHIKSRAYMSVLAAMELSESVPEVDFVESIDTDGIELIKALRSV